MLSQGLDYLRSDVPIHLTLMPTVERSSFPEDMSQPQRSSSTDSASDSIRKRVCKACDRCRLKKSKCDGSNPCSRCKADNAICVFGERKKSHDKVYPKGYVEMLEQQQGQLVSGLQEMYRRLLAGQHWPGAALSETSGHPLTHDILAALNLLEVKHDGSGEMEAFDEDCRKLQSRLFQAGAPCMRRKGSFSSESDHSQRGNSISTGLSTPNLVKPSMFKENFTFSTPSSPVVQSPTPRKRQPHPPVHQSPLHQSRQLSNDPELYQREWSNLAESGSPEAIMRSRFAMEGPNIQSNLDDVADMLSGGEWIEPNVRYDSAVNGLTSYPAQYSNPFDNLSNFQDFGTNMDTMEIDFNRWIQVQM